METKRIYSSKYCEMDHLPRLNVLQVKWMGFIQGEVFQEVNIALLNAIKTTRSDKILMDNSEARILPMMESQSILKDFTPLVSQLGVKKSALLQSDSISHQLSIQNLLDEIDNKYKDTIKIFYDINKAWKWLRE